MKRAWLAYPGECGMWQFFMLSIQQTTFGRSVFYPEPQAESPSDISWPLGDVWNRIRGRGIYIYINSMIPWRQLRHQHVIYIFIFEGDSEHMLVVCLEDYQVQSQDVTVIGLSIWFSGISYMTFLYF